MSDANFIPYGKSMLEGARKVWKQLQLMEDAMLIHRIMRAPEKRIFKLDIGNIPPNEVENFMQQIINKMKKIPVIDQTTGDYNLKFNVQNMTEDFFIPIRGTDTATRIDTTKGLDYDGTNDIEYLKAKMMAALKIPKPFLGYEEGVEGKSTLVGMDIRFARTVERVQRIIESELTKIALVHLYSQGFDDEKLVDFSLELTTPSIIYEQEKIELYTSKTTVAQQMLDNNVKPCSLNFLLKKSDIIYVLASITSKNQNLINKSKFNMIKRNACFILISRAAIINFSDFYKKLKSKQIYAAIDVFPIEPVSKSDPIRKLDNVIFSAHRAGALDAVFKEMGNIVYEDMLLIQKNLPPRLCKRAERETVGLLRSKPVDHN